MSMSFYHSIPVDYVGGVEVKLYCDDYPTMWIDGVVYRGTIGERYMNATVSDDMKLLAVKCFDAFLNGRFAASVGYDGNVLISDGHWKCSDQLSEYESHHWYKLDFDDSHWNHAYVIRLNNIRAPKYFKDLPQKVAWLWSDDDYDRRSGISHRRLKEVYIAAVRY